MTRIHYFGKCGYHEGRANWVCRLSSALVHHNLVEKVSGAVVYLVHRTVHAGTKISVMTEVRDPSGFYSETTMFYVERTWLRPHLNAFPKVTILKK